MPILPRIFFAALILPLSSGFIDGSEPVLVEAESGDRGAEMVEAEIGGVTAVTTSTDGAGTSPGAAARLVSLTVDFPQAGTYQLYARVFVGGESGNDDSFFYGNGFGEKDPARDSDWILVNQLAFGVGSTEVDDSVPGLGVAGSEVWKWVMLSSFDGGEQPIEFEVPEDQLTQTLQFGAREDGLYVDKLAFGFDGYFYTVGNLENGEPCQESTPNEPFTPTGPPMAEKKWKWLGNVHSANQLESFAAYWNQVTPENAGKWGSVEGARDAMNWAELDSAYQFAKDKGFPFRMHVLIWGAQQPDWINDLPVEEQREEIEEWIAAVAERYPDIDYLEVVNEPLHQAPDGGDTGVVSGRANYIEALGGTGETGWDWVIESFRLARESFPNTPLVINDYGIIGDAGNVNRYLEIIDLLMEENLIDVIAFQAHAFSTRSSAATLQANLDTLASRGLPIIVTEMDVDGGTDVAQLADYQEIFPVFWEHPSVVGVTLWGFRPGMWRSEQGAYLVLNNGAERPAMTWLQDYVRDSDYPNFDGMLEGAGLSPDVHAFQSDADGDGLPTGIEYLLDSDPAEPDRGAAPWVAVDELGHVQVRFSTAPRDGKVAIQSSRDLIDWTTEGTFDLGLRRAFNLKVQAEERSWLIESRSSLKREEEARFYRVCFSR